MATEKRLLDDLDAVSDVSWTNESNAFVEDENYAESAALGVNKAAGGDYQQISYTPTGFSEFKIRFFDVNSNHTDDTYDLQFYNNHTSSWAGLETYDSLNLLPTSLTTVDKTSALSAAYTTATDKTAFLNNLAVRFYGTAKINPADRVEFGFAWSYFVYTYTAPTDVFHENKNPIEQGMKPNTAAGMGGVLIE